MLLAVDIGNTNIKVGAWDGDQLIFVSAMHTNVLRTADEYAARLLDVFRLHSCNGAQFDAAMISNVVPPLSSVLTAAVAQVIQSNRVYLAAPTMESGLEIAVDSPATLGPDLVCAAAAVAKKMPLPCVMIGLGTANIIFAIDKDSRLTGGAVGPGVSISIDALANRTAQLPHISLENPGPLIGKNTVDCMKSGIIYGTACMLDGMIGRMREELEGDLHAVAFGGLARGIIPYCRETITLDDTLVLEGLKIIYEKNMQTLLGQSDATTRRR